MERRPQLFWPLVFIAAGIIWIMIELGRMPAANLWALTYVWPLLLIAAGVGLILRPYWSWAPTLMSAVVVAALFIAVLFAAQLGWNQVPSFGNDGPVFWAAGGTRGSGDVITQDRDVKGFTSIQIGFPGNVVIRQGTTESLTIEAEDNVVAAIKTQVVGDVLEIKDVHDHRISVSPTKPVKITITAKSLKSVSFDAAGDVIVQGLSTGSFEAELNGAGNITLQNVKVQSLQTRLDGAGSLHASGTTDDLTVNLNGVGSFDGKELQAKSANVDVNGLGSADVWVSSSLSADINGMGSVNYYGSPQVSKTIVGLGSVHAMGSK